MSGRRRNKYIGDREVERYFRREAKERARDERERDEQEDEEEETGESRRKPMSEHRQGSYQGGYQDGTDPQAGE